MKIVFTKITYLGGLWVQNYKSAFFFCYKNGYKSLKNER